MRSAGVFDSITLFVETSVGTFTGWPEVDYVCKEEEGEDEGTNPLHDAGSRDDAVAATVVANDFTSARGVKADKAQEDGDGKGEENRLDNSHGLEVPEVVVVVLGERKDLNRLEEHREADTNNENDGHGPVDGRVFERIKDAEQDERSGTNDGKDDRDNVENRLFLLQTSRDSALMAQVTLHEDGQDVECGRERREDDKVGVVRSADIGDKDDVCLGVLVFWEAIGSPKTQETNDVAKKLRQS